MKAGGTKCAPAVAVVVEKLHDDDCCRSKEHNKKREKHIHVFIHSFTHLYVRSTTDQYEIHRVTTPCYCLVRALVLKVFLLL